MLPDYIISPPPSSTPTLPAFHDALHAWYALRGRKNLPWRNTQDAYAIYLSEVMLQQTQVTTVLSRFYFPFLEQFPTLRSLAEAPREEVLKAWEGLGYYSRAVNLHRAAIECGGALPSTVDALMALPGIGRNTAHAVAAFGFGASVPVMEANVKRVLHRVHARETMNEKELWNAAHALLDANRPFDYNQAMMDLGALVCTPRAPKCAECPANGICLGTRDPESYPAKKAKKALPVRCMQIFVPRNAEGFFFAAPRKTRFLSGMYHFLEAPLGENEKTLPAQRLRKLLEKAGLPCEHSQKRKLGAVAHDYSHFRLEAEVFVLPNFPAAEKNWFNLVELQQLPHSRTEKKIFKLLAECN